MQQKENTPLKNRTLLLLLLTVGFVGATSCGNDSSNQSSQLDNAAMQAALANRGKGNVNVTQTVIATSVANVTVTAVNSHSSTGTVVYTVTATNSSTATRM
jgi:hypothetical protein